ncbi:hypothetical protein GW17_00044730, partial [Ensete ventricosum]
AAAVGAAARLQRREQRNKSREAVLAEKCGQWLKSEVGEYVPGMVVQRRKLVVVL